MNEPERFVSSQAAGVSSAAQAGRIATTDTLLFLILANGRQCRVGPIINLASARQGWRGAFARAYFAATKSSA